MDKGYHTEWALGWIGSPGADPGGGGVPGGQDLPFWGTPKLHKEVKRKNVSRMHTKTPHFSTVLTVTRTPPPFRNHVYAPAGRYIQMFLWITDSIGSSLCPPPTFSLSYS